MLRRPTRLADFQYVGLSAYFLTLCVDQRRPVFSDATHAKAARDQFLRTAADYAFAVIAYCFMPDHLHALVEGLGNRSDFCRFVSMFKQRSSFDHRRRSGGRLWQHGYFEHVVRSEDTYPSIAAYILNNPLRAGLCDQMTAYTYLGSDRYTVEELEDFVAIDPKNQWRP